MKISTLRQMPRKPTADESFLSLIAHHDTGDVVADDKDQQRVEQAVAAAKKVAKPASDSGKNKL
jgi:hypothetical protein